MLPANLIECELFGHDKVVSISIDDKREQWIEAVNNDKLDWTQILDDAKLIDKKYGLEQVPSNFLIGPKGKILARDLRGKELMETFFYDSTGYIYAFT